MDMGTVWLIRYPFGRQFMNELQDKSCVRCFSFKGVFVGALVAFGLIFLFNLLTLAGGLSAYTKTEKGLETLVFIAYLWLVAGSFLMFYISGFVTGMVSKQNDEPSHCSSFTYGITVWVVYLLITLAFVSKTTENTVFSFPQYFVTISSDSASHAQNAAQNAIEESSEDREADHHGLTNSETRHEAHKIGLATLATFFIFLIEVVGASFGAWCGMNAKRKECAKY